MICIRGKNSVNDIIHHTVPVSTTIIFYESFKCHWDQMHIVWTSEAILLNVLPVLPVFFMEVLLDDLTSKPSSVSSWHSWETHACSSGMLTGDWFFSPHSGYIDAHLHGPCIPSSRYRSKNQNRHRLIFLHRSWVMGV